MAVPKAVRMGCDEQITLTATAAYTPGDVVRLWPGMVGIVVGTINEAIGDPVTFATEGKWQLPMASGGTASLGNAAYWDSSSSLVVAAAPTTGFYLGRFVKAKTSGQTVAEIELNGQDIPGSDLGVVQNIRRRFTIAEVNAGATLLPALAGTKYRMVSATAIAVGGAAAAVTTVDILGTQTTAVKLVAFAQASLTQNTQLTSGGSGAAILAAGASFVANDVNTAVTVGITGSSVTTATHIDINFNYAREAG
jgi:predicted RecA/RadA family phage recombinase